MRGTAPRWLSRIEIPKPVTRLRGRHSRTRLPLADRAGVDIPGDRRAVLLFRRAITSTRQDLPAPRAKALPMKPWIAAQDEKPGTIVLANAPPVPPPATSWTIARPGSAMEAMTEGSAPGVTATGAPHPGTVTRAAESMTATGMPPASGTVLIATDAGAIGAIVTGAQAVGVMSAVIGSEARLPAVDPHQDRSPGALGPAGVLRAATAGPRAAAGVLPAAALAALRATAPGASVRQAAGRPASVGSQPDHRTRNGRVAGKTAPGLTAVPRTANVEAVPRKEAKERTAQVPGPTTPAT